MRIFPHSIIAPHSWGFLFVGGWVDFDMVRYISLLLFIGLAFWSCDDENDNNENNTTLSGLDTILPSIQILSPLDAEILTDNTIVLTDNTIIDVDTYDNESLSRVEFFIKKTFSICPPWVSCPDSLVYTDSDTPFSFYWDIYDFECGRHSLKAIAYDNSNNSSSALNNYILDQVINIPCDITTSSISEESLNYAEFLDQKWVTDCLIKDNQIQGVMKSNKGVTITFNSGGPDFSGYGGCNHYWGNFSNKNAPDIGYPLSFDIDGWTRMGCTTPECQMD